MKVRTTKEQQRERLRRDMERFLSRGGSIKRVPPGTSGEPPRGARPLSPFSHTPRPPRTDLSRLAATIDARKHKPKVRRTRSAAPRRRLIYDDFGEPLRWVWGDATTAPDTPDKENS
ncbi:hypothetical protein SAMN05877962_13134 [Alloalcanivorax xenomutans]|uniref:hypothetical protein n=1 Tax=Alloalcanivorax xenomutans TaxID=1094342 RepID=UPI000BCB8EBC|nr:hypothetical protein [Alloalcanivorax xenomutans]SOC27901.1 hypothetical protein SAMN05877962_13134 [Alloalcanivorax xenomutans]